MHAGIPQNCAFYAPGQICEPQEEKYDMWQVPMWTLSATGKEYTMVRWPARGVAWWRRGVGGCAR